MHPAGEIGPATGSAGGGGGGVGTSVTRCRGLKKSGHGGCGGAGGAGSGPTMKPQPPKSLVNGPQYSPGPGSPFGLGGTTGTMPAGTLGAVQTAGYLTEAMASCCAMVSGSGMPPAAYGGTRAGKSPPLWARTYRGRCCAERGVAAIRARVTDHAARRRNMRTFSSLLLGPVSGAAVASATAPDIQY